MKFREVIRVPIFQELKCFETKALADRCAYDGPSYRFVMKFKEVILVPIFQELKCFETKALDGPLCL